MSASEPRQDLVCPACTGSGRATSFRMNEPGHGSIVLVRCRRCKTEYWRNAGPSNPAGTESEYWEDYKFQLYGDDAVRKSYESRYSRLMALLVRLGRSPKEIVDIGGGIGNFALWVQHEGIGVSMIDVDADAVAVAKDRGIQAYQSEEVGSLRNEPSADLVTLWDVVEHVVDPAELVRQGLLHLRPNGTLFIETPDARFPLRKVLLALRLLTKARLDWTPGLYYYEHKVYFTEQGLAALLNRCGARLLRVERWPSPSAKMVRLLGREGSIGQSSVGYRALGRLYPALEALLERIGAGNKLLVVAVRG